MMTLTEILSYPRGRTESSHTHATVRQVRHHGRDAASIDLAVPRSWPRHLPGQFVAAGVQLDGVWQERCFSITSRPDDRTVQITVQSRPDGVVSRHLVDRLTPGRPIRLSRPTGAFVLPDRPGRLLMVTAGSGLTPVVGMIRALRSMPELPNELDVVWVHHARTPSDLLFADELTRWRDEVPWLRLDLRFTGHGDQRFDASQLAGVCPDWADRATYVCGPTALSDSLGVIWAEAGIEHRFITESFRGVGGHSRPPADGSDDPVAAATVLAARSDVLFDGHAGATLLDAAESAGMSPKFGCRMGICHTCTTRLDDGCVRDLRDGRRHGAGSHVQLCVSAPDGDITLDL